MGKCAIPGVAIPCLLAMLFSLSANVSAPPAQIPSARPAPAPAAAPSQSPAVSLRPSFQPAHIPGQDIFVPPPPAYSPPATGATAGQLRLAATESIPLASPGEFIAAMAPPAGAGALPATAVALAPQQSRVVVPLGDCGPIPPAGPRDKGWTARTFGQYLTGNEGYFYKPTEYSKFDLKGMEYGVGLRRDMSIDSIFGLSFRALDYRVTGAGYDDKRKNSITGWLAEVDYSKRFSLPVFNDLPFMLEGSLGYGTLGNKGSGQYAGLAWREKKHDSTLYRASAKVKTSDRTQYAFYFESEFGVELTRISSDAYMAEWGPMATQFTMAEKTSTSLSVPLRATIWEEYQFRWGTGIFRLMLGGRYDFGNGGTAAYSFNASAGGYATPDMAARKVDLYYDPRGCEWEIGAGADIWANRGWYFRADYKARFSGSLNQINENLFSVELGACF